MTEADDARVREIARKLSLRMAKTLMHGDLYRTHWHTFSALRGRGLVDTVPPRRTDLGRAVAAHLARAQDQGERE